MQLKFRPALPMKGASWKGGTGGRPPIKAGGDNAAPPRKGARAAWTPRKNKAPTGAAHGKSYGHQYNRTGPEQRSAAHAVRRPTPGAARQALGGQQPDQGRGGGAGKDLPDAYDPSRKEDFRTKAFPHLSLGLNSRYQTVGNSDQFGVLRDNLSAANSNIKDVDVAQESTRYARYNILVQAGTAMLAQANATPQTALRLLQ